MSLEFGYMPQQCGWVAAAIGGAISLGSTIFGASQSAKKEREAKAKEESAHNANMAYWKRKYNEDYSDTAAGQNMIRQAREYADRNWKKAHGASAVGGGTDVATAMAKEQGNKVVGNTLANMAANDTHRKDAAGAAMANERSNYAYKQAGQLRTEGANVAQAASAMGNAVGGAVSSIGGEIESRGSSGNAPKMSEAEKSDINEYYKNNPDEWKTTKASIATGVDKATETEEYKNFQKKILNGNW